MMEKGLHEYPEKLRKSLQTEIDRRDGNETVVVVLRTVQGTPAWG
jgi:hypothetical protein